MMEAEEASAGMAPDRRDALARYAELRKAAAHEAQSILLEVGIDVEFRSISERDIVLAEKWQFDDFRRQWSWRSEVSLLEPRSRHLLAAVDAGQDRRLCAMLLGRISDARICGSLHYIHRDPDPENPLRGRVLTVATTYLETCAATFGCSIVRLRDPADGLVKAYNALGYGTDRILGERKVKWLEKDLTALSTPELQLTWNGASSESDLPPKP